MGILQPLTGEADEGPVDHEESSAGNLLEYLRQIPLLSELNYGAKSESSESQTNL